MFSVAVSKPGWTGSVVMEPAAKVNDVYYLAVQTAATISHNTSDYYTLLNRTVLHIYYIIYS